MQSLKFKVGPATSANALRVSVHPSKWTTTTLVPGGFRFVDFFAVAATIALAGRRLDFHASWNISQTLLPRKSSSE